jgi:formylglycine-generating enzyme required for sulfatase activity
MSSDTPPVESAQDIQVRLKPIFGVEPKFYLAGLYTLIVLAILLAVLVLPGINNPGTRVTVTSIPAGAAVDFGAKHWGTTPLTVFLPQGSALLTVAKPGFVPDVQTFQSGNNWFFSLVFPRTDSLTVTLKPVSATSVPTIARNEVGRWALAAPFTSDYRFPPLFTRFAADARAAEWSPAAIQEFLLGLREAVADPQMYQDYGRALGLWSAEASAPDGLKAQFDLWEPLVGSGSSRLALWLLANQPKPVRDRELAEKSDWFQARIAEFTASLKAPATVASGALPVLKTSFGSFRTVPSTPYLWGSDGTSFPVPSEPPFALPVPVTTKAFWIAEREVSQGEFAEFVAAVPRWAPAGRDQLVAGGLADPDYLVGWQDGKPSAPAEPVSSVSWYAAQAFADWLNASGRVPSGKKVVLPDEFQWEAAARSPAGASMLNQGVWEWTATAWYPGQSLVWTGVEGAAEPSAYARSLKGGIQSTKGSVKPGDRAGWPATGATPGLGFRLALVGAP